MARRQVGPLYCRRRIRHPEEWSVSVTGSKSSARNGKWLNSGGFDGVGGDYRYQLIGIMFIADGDLGIRLTMRRSLRERNTGIAGAVLTRRVVSSDSPRNLT